MRFLIKAYECMYGGLHGMNSIKIENCVDEEEAEEIAKESSIDIMYSYSGIINELERQALDYYDEEDEAYDDFLDELILENVDYELYPIKEGVSLSDNELEKLAYDDFESARKKYTFDL